jgi:hypothetical protein
VLGNPLNSLPNKGIEHPRKRACQLNRRAEHRERDAVFTANRYRLVLIFVSQHYEIPLIENTFLVGKGAL